MTFSSALLSSLLVVLLPFSAAETNKEIMDTPTRAQLDMLSHFAQEISGPLVIGAMLAVLLYGVLLMQMIAYWSSGRSDSLTIKAIVVWMLLLGTLAGGCCMYFPYYYGVSSFGNLQAIGIIDPTAVVVVVILAVAGVTARSFYAWRIVILTKSWIIPSIIWALCAAQIGCMIFAVYRAEQLLEFRKFVQFSASIIVWSALGPVTDIMMSVTQIVYLQRHRTGFSKTDTIISRLIRLIVQTGLISAVGSLVSLALFVYAVKASKNVYFVIEFPLAVVYMNCVMANLNGRISSTMGTSQVEDSLPSKNRIQVSTVASVQHDVELGPVRSPAAARFSQISPSTLNERDYESGHDDVFVRGKEPY